MRFLATISTIALVAVGFGQNVRPMAMGSSTTKAAKRLADEQNINWPDLFSGESGTQISFSADNRNADAIITSTVDRDTLLKIVQAAAKELGLPKTDFIQRQGTVTASVDMEFNDYLEHRGATSSFTFPVGKLVEILNRNSALRPIVAFVEADPEVRILNRGSQSESFVEGTPVLLDEKQLKGVTDLRVTAHQAWWSPIAGWTAFLIGATLMFSAFILPIGMAIKAWKFGDKLEEEPPKPTPEEIQARYDQAKLDTKSKPLAKLVSFFPVIFFALFALTRLPALRPIGRQIIYGIPDFVVDALSNMNPISILPFMVIPVAFTWVLIFFLKKRRKLKTPPMPMGASFVWLGVGMAYLFVCILALPILRGKIATEWIRPIIFAPLSLAIAGSFWSMYRESERKLTILPKDDPIRKVAEELGDLAGIRVRRVVVRDAGGSVNAFATLFGTVGITKALRDQLPDDEIRAILAHEVAHLKARDVPRFLIQTMGTFVIVFGGIWVAETVSPAFRQSGATTFVSTFAYFASVPISWFLAPQRKRSEISADQFAVKVSGVETVERALTRIHDLNGLPHRMDHSDLRLASHPDLVTRLKRLHDHVDE